MSRPPSPAKLRKAANRWTAKHPAGTPVRYWTGASNGDGHIGATLRFGVTTSGGEVLGGRAGVHIDGAGFVEITHVEALPANGVQPCLIDDCDSHHCPRCGVHTLGRVSSCELCDIQDEVAP